MAWHKTINDEKTNKSSNTAYEIKDWKTEIKKKECGIGNPIGYAVFIIQIT